MDVRKQCWFKGCALPGEHRPLYATVHGLHASLRLCRRHMSELSRDPDRAAASVERPGERG